MIALKFTTGKLRVCNSLFLFAADRAAMRRPQWEQEHEEQG
jgi:hypothetical protein